MTWKSRFRMKYFKRAIYKWYLQLQNGIYKWDVDLNLSIESGFWTDLGKRKGELSSEEQWPWSGKSCETSRIALTGAKSLLKSGKIKVRKMEFSLWRNI